MKIFAKLNMTLLLIVSLFIAQIYAKPIDDIISLAFDPYEFVFEEKPAISPNGQIIAYSVRQKPENLDLSERRLSNGTPRYSVGSRIHLFQKNTNETSDLDSTIVGDCWRPSWSPDGLKLAFYSNEGGSVRLWIYDLTKKESKKVGDFSIKSTIFAVDIPAWSPDGKTVYVPLDPSEKTANEEEQPQKEIVKTYSTSDDNNTTQIWSEDFLIKEYSTNLAAIDIQTASARILVTSHDDPEPGFLKISPTGQWLSYLSRPNLMDDPYLPYGELAVVSTAEQSSVIKIDKGVCSKDCGFDCYAWHPTLDALVYVKEKKLFLMKIDENGSPVIKEIYENPNANLFANPLLFNHDGTAIIVGANPQHDSSHLYAQNILIIPLDGKSAVQDIKIEDGWHCIDLLQSSPSQAWQPQGSAITARLENVKNREQAIVRFNFNQLPQVLWKGMARISDFASSSRSESIYFQFEDIKTPPNLYRANQNFSHFEQISAIDPRMNDLEVPTQEVFETIVPLYNGELQKVRTTVLFPKGPKPKGGFPGIVLFYPGADVSKMSRNFCGGNLVTIPNFVFLEAGYALIFPDIVLGPEGTAGNPLQEIVDTLLPQVYHASQLGYVSIDQLGIVGQSYGGYGAAATISKTGIFKAAVAISGLYDLPGHYHNMIGWSEDGQGRMGSHPWENLSRYINNSPYFLADRIHTPLMLIHGEKDGTCNVQEAQKMFAALKRLNRDAQLAIYPNQGHCIDEWLRPSAIDATQRILNFLDYQLMTKQPSYDEQLIQKDHLKN